MTYLIGTAGWSLPREEQPHFPAEGTHLQRYAAVLPAVEINSSFYRPHRASTYTRWAASVPPAFRFAVKIPRAITHERKLADAGAALDAFLPGPTALGDALGCLLVQLPPSLALDERRAARFLRDLRDRYDGPAAIEPRHPTWFTPDADAMLRDARVARVAADPPPAPEDGAPGGFAGLAYYRLHGAPRIYYSNYDDAYLDALAERLQRVRRLRAHAGDVWCVFDNTALGAAWANARALLARLHER